MGRQDSKDKYKLSAVDSIERLPLSEQVYLTLKTAILTGELMPQSLPSGDAPPRTCHTAYGT